MRAFRCWTICGIVAVTTLTAVPAAWAADNRAAAEPLFFNQPVATDISGFGVEIDEPSTVPGAESPCATAARTTWHQLEGTGTDLTLTTDGSDTTDDEDDTVLAVYRLEEGNPVPVLVACDDDSGLTAKSARLTFTSDALTAYYVQAGAFCFDAVTCGPAADQGTIRVLASNAGAPSNDLRATPTHLALNSQTHQSNFGATVDPGEALYCAASEAPYGRTLWFDFQLPRRGLVRIRSGADGADSVLALYPAASASALTCNDDAGPGNRQSVLSLDLNAGDYRLQLGGYNDLSGARPLFGKLADFPIAIDFTPNFDLDADGVLSPAGGGGDCNDDSAAIRPGAADPPSDGIDQNCDGRDPRDGDRDGVLAPPDGGDCNDADAAIRPGIPEIVANPIDENCDGVPALGQVSSSVQFLFDRVGCRGISCRGIRLTRYVVVGIPAGATVTLRCTGRGCPFTTKQTTLKNATAKLSRLSLFRRRTLRRGAVVRLTVTAPHRVGIVKTQTVGRRSLSTPRTQCLPPGASKPGRCDF